jgi:sulfopyruvate decarboxylase subunit beta
VPDTNQRTVLEALDERGDRPVVRLATEDDVFGVCAGLWLAGHRPLALVQQLGLFAGVNALRAFTHDQGVPLAVLAGLYGRELDRAPADSDASAVRLCEPLLDALGLGWLLVEGPSDAGLIAPHLAGAFETLSTRVLILGAPTT